MSLANSGSIIHLAITYSVIIIAYLKIVHFLSASWHALMSTFFLTLRMPFRMEKIENIIKNTLGTKILGIRDGDNQRGVLGVRVCWGIFGHVAYGIKSQPGMKAIPAQPGKFPS